MLDYSLIDHILEAIFPLPTQFGLLYKEESDDAPVNLVELEEALCSIDPEAKVDYGVTKLVISSPKLAGVVIKIPFNGIFYGAYWTPFVFAPGSDKSDYCLAEYEKYNSLKEHDLGCFVAKTSFYKTVDGRRIFLQEFVTPEYEIIASPKPSKKSDDLAKKIAKKRGFYYNKTWLANCLENYGEDAVIQLFEYYRLVDRDILSDLHDGNIGYREDGTPAILDFSNFKD